jgi:hypothetical protein
VEGNFGMGLGGVGIEDKLKLRRVLYRKIGFSGSILEAISTPGPL